MIVKEGRKGEVTVIAGLDGLDTQTMDKIDPPLDLKILVICILLVILVAIGICTAVWFILLLDSIAINLGHIVEQSRKGKIENGTI